jgi:hypothetical protein
MLVFLMTVGFAGCLQKCLPQIVKWMMDIKPDLINQLIMLIIQGRRQAKNIAGISHDRYRVQCMYDLGITPS